MLGLWLRYLLLWPGIHRLGQLRDADVIVALSFGRNMVPDNRLFVVPTLHQRLCASLDAVTIEQLQTEQFDPGPHNRAMARIVEDIINAAPRRTFVQWEIAAAFDPEWFRNQRDHITILWPPLQRGGNFYTRDVLMQVRTFLNRPGKVRIGLIAHQRLIARSMLVSRKIFGLTPVVPDQNVTGFNPDSVQPWTRTAVRWLWREWLARVLMILTRWI